MTPYSAPHSNHGLDFWRLLHGHGPLAAQMLKLMALGRTSPANAPQRAARVLAHATQQGLTTPEGVLLMARLWAWAQLPPTIESLIQVASVGQSHTVSREQALNALQRWALEITAWQAAAQSAPARQATPQASAAKLRVNQLNRVELWFAEAVFDCGSLQAAAKHLSSSTPLAPYHLLAANIIEKLGVSLPGAVLQRAVGEAVRGLGLNSAEQQALDQALQKVARLAESQGAFDLNGVDETSSPPASSHMVRPAMSERPLRASLARLKTLPQRVDGLEALAGLKAAQRMLIAQWVEAGGSQEQVQRALKLTSRKTIATALAAARQALGAPDNRSLHIRLCQALRWPLHPSPNNMPSGVVGLYETLAQNSYVMGAYPSARELEVLAYRMAGLDAKEAALWMNLHASVVAVRQKHTATRFGLLQAAPLNSHIAEKTGLPLYAAPEGMPADAQGIYESLAIHLDVIRAAPSRRELEAAAYRLADYSESDSTRLMGLSRSSSTNVRAFVNRFASKFNATDGPALREQLAKRLSLPQYPIPPDMPLRVARTYLAITAEPRIVSTFSGRRSLQALAYRLAGYSNAVAAELMRISPHGVDSLIGDITRRFKLTGAAALQRWMTQLLGWPLYPVLEGTPKNVEALYLKLARNERITELEPTWHELQVLAYAASGAHSTQEISAHSGVAESTVRSAVTRWSLALKVSSLAGLQTWLKALLA
jgi:DNA-binding CsgD family transcriptional regulator